MYVYRGSYRSTISILKGHVRSVTLAVGAMSVAATIVRHGRTGFLWVAVAGAEPPSSKATASAATAYSPITHSMPPPASVSPT